MHRRKQFTILQLVQLSSVKSSLTRLYALRRILKPKHASRGGDVTNRQRACCRLVSVVGRATVQRRTEAVAACSSSLYTDSVNTAGQLKSLYQEWTRLAIVDLILVLGGSFLVIAQQWALSSNVHVRYVLLIE